MCVEKRLLRREQNPWWECIVFWYFKLMRVVPTAQQQSNIHLYYTLQLHNGRRSPLKVFATDVIAILACQGACAAGGRAFIAEQRLRHVQVGGPMYQLCKYTQRCWLGVARRADRCQLQLGLRATGYWLVIYDFRAQTEGTVRFRE